MPAETPPKPAPETDRIAKVMARAGVASRRDAEKMIVEGRVAVNGKVVKSPALDVSPADRVTLDGKPIEAPQETRMWLYYKPLGLVTSEKDEKGRQTVFDTLPPGLPRVMSVGRLDLNSEGLLLLTNDGGLKRRLELPETGWLRKYRVRVNGRPNEATFDPLRRGITIEGEDFQPMEIELDRQQGANAWLTVGIREGRNREVRRAMEAVKLTVNRLIRVSYGPFRLNDMQPGDVVEVKRKVLREQLGERLLTGTEGAPEKVARRPRPAAAPEGEKRPFMRKPREAPGDATAGADAATPRKPRAAGMKSHADRDGAERKPYTPREGAERKPYAPREGAERKPYAPREGAERKPYAPREGAERKPYAPREGAERKPYAPREGAERKPYAPREGAERKPYAPREGAERKPYAPREGAERKPYAPREGAERKPYAPREGAERKPYAPREGAERKPYAPREGAERKPYAPREGAERKPYAPREGAERKPYAPREGAERKPYAPREGAERKPYAPRDGAERKPYAPREGAERKPYAPREGAERKPYAPREGAERKPYAPREGAAGKPRSSGFKSHGGAAGKATGFKSHGGQPGGKPAGGGKPGPKGRPKPGSGS